MDTSASPTSEAATMPCPRRLRFPRLHSTHPTVPMSSAAGSGIRIAERVFRSTKPMSSSLHRRGKRFSQKLASHGSREPEGTEPLPRSQAAVSFSPRRASRESACNHVGGRSRPKETGRGYAAEMTMPKTMTWTTLWAGILLAAACGGASGPSTPGPVDMDDARPGPRGDGDSEQEAYAGVIGEDAVSDEGVFIVHEVDGDYLFEIPDSLLDRDMLLISRISGVQSGMGGFAPAGVASNRQMIRFERRDDRILMRKYSGEAVADDTLAIAASVQANYLAPILRSFDIEARGPDSTTSVIDVTSFFEGDNRSISGLSPGQRRDYGVRRLDPARSFIDGMSSYPMNINVRHTLTYDASDPPSDERANTVSMEMNQSLVLLPAQPMRPRYADPRVGYFSINRINYGLDEQKAATQTFIRRWR
ncbi:MAG TPA: DUF5117 domain-containing protein, partial [Gemmatimonadetes bacterium]|nr:DUF5117 domain-containing protein [Gemmatimonadota bacterium]